jgi:hypothetical protein
MDEENVAYICTGVLLKHKEEWNSFVFREMDGTGDHCIKRNKPVSQKQVLYIFSHVWNIGYGKSMKMKGGCEREQGGELRK